MAEVPVCNKQITNYFLSCYFEVSLHALSLRLVQEKIELLGYDVSVGTRVVQSGITTNLN